MSYFPSDEELEENGVKIPKDAKEKKFPIDVYIYHLDLNVEKPVLGKIPARFIRDDSYTPVVYSAGPNVYRIWYDDFDYEMLGVIYEPLDNVIEIIVRRDDISSNEAVMLIQNYCCKKAATFRKRLDMFNRGIGAATEFYFRDSWNV